MMIKSLLAPLALLLVIAGAREASAQTTTRTLNAPRNYVPLDISTVTTGGVAVTALAAGHRTAGGWLFNPVEATVKLCIDESGATAAGTTSSGNVTCVAPGTTYMLMPGPASVSVITSDSAHAFSGQGWAP
jgi:hypothetical protein